MKAKVFLLATALCGSVMTASAQSKGDVRFGLTAGMNVANITDMKAKSRIGFNIGLRGEYNFSSSIYGNAALLYSMKGAKSDVFLLDRVLPRATGAKLNPCYLELPVHIGYRYDLGNNVSVFGETGPYLAYGVGGKYKANAGNADASWKLFDSNGMDAKRFDVGWGLRAGVEASGVQIHVSYDYGFCKMFNFGGHNSNVAFGLTYMF